MEKQGIKAYESNCVKTQAVSMGGLCARFGPSGRVLEATQGSELGRAVFWSYPSCGTLNKFNNLPGHYQVSQFKNGAMWCRVTHDCTPSTWEGKAGHSNHSASLG